jgi:hypothetical protein
MRRPIFIKQNLNGSEPEFAGYTTLTALLASENLREQYVFYRRALLKQHWIIPPGNQIRILKINLNRKNDGRRNK